MGAGRFTAVFAPRSKKGYAEEKKGCKAKKATNWILEFERTLEGGRLGDVHKLCCLKREEEWGSTPKDESIQNCF